MNDAAIGVIGAGSWGTALAQTLADGGHHVRLWARSAEVIATINDRRENPLFLPGLTLSDRIRATADLDWVGEARAVLVATPAQPMRAVLRVMRRHARPLILCAKGLEAGTHRLMHEVAREEHPDSPIAVLSGPTFAREVAAGLPTAITLAAEDEELARSLTALIARPAFRVYASTDVIGTEIGGAVKNVLAIACGVVEGAGLGQNARAALISRGFAEMARFGLARGARAETLAGLSGLGDLVLTCSSVQSRNYSLGLGLGRGADARALLADRRSVAEGASTAPVLLQAATIAGVDMPIVGAVRDLLAGVASAGDVVARLLARPLRSERENPA